MNILNKIYRYSCFYFKNPHESKMLNQPRHIPSMGRFKNWYVVTKKPGREVLSWPSSVLDTRSTFQHPVFKYLKIMNCIYYRKFSIMFVKCYLWEDWVHSPKCKPTVLTLHYCNLRHILYLTESLQVTLCWQLCKIHARRQHRSTLTPRHSTWPCCSLAHTPAILVVSPNLSAGPVVPRREQELCSTGHFMCQIVLSPLHTNLLMTVNLQRHCYSPILQNRKPRLRNINLVACVSGRGCGDSAPQRSPCPTILSPFPTLSLPLA